MNDCGLSFQDVTNVDVSNFMTEMTRTGSPTDMTRGTVGNYVKAMKLLYNRETTWKALERAHDGPQPDKLTATMVLSKVSITIMWLINNLSKKYIFFV
jgi:hypothetical protein